MFKAQIQNLQDNLKKRGFLWVQGPGGNFSFKENNKLFIKPSGKRIEDIHSWGDLAVLDYPKFLCSILEVIQGNENSEQAYSSCIEKYSLPKKRASMESGFHAILPHKNIIHLHSVAILLLVELHGNYPDKINKWVSSIIPYKFIFIPKVLPGYKLTKYLGNCQAYEWFFLKNHGIILASDQDIILEEFMEFEEKFLKDFSFEILYKIFSTHNLRAEISRKPTPWKVYFPDTAVFATSLRAALKIVAPPEDACYDIIHNADTHSNKDLLELWQATAILYHSNPSLEEWTEIESALIMNMPTETYRQTLGDIQPHE